MKHTVPAVFMAIIGAAPAVAASARDTPARCRFAGNSRTSSAAPAHLAVSDCENGPGCGGSSCRSEIAPGGNTNLTDPRASIIGGTHAVAQQMDACRYRRFTVTADNGCHPGSTADVVALCRSVDGHAANIAMPKEQRFSSADPRAMHPSATNSSRPVSPRVRKRLALRRPPAVPIFTHAPGFGTGLAADRPNDDIPRHWPGHVRGSSLIARVEGEARALPSPAVARRAGQRALHITPTSTVAVFGKQEGFPARSVGGGFSVKLPADQAVWNRWRERLPRA